MLALQYSYKFSLRYIVSPSKNLSSPNPHVLFQEFKTNITRSID